MDIATLRKEYRLARLDESTLAQAPHIQFERWLNEALKARLPEPTAMTLATVSAQGQPAVRIVLLKGHDERGFVFFTNYESRKGRELAQQPLASLLFHWTELERQVRIDGQIARVSAEESDAYFRTRPLESQLGAWASPQSEVIGDRDSLLERFAAARSKYGESVPRPAHWGGFRLQPQSVEFWQGRESRLHDRLRYRRLPEGGWTIERLAP